MKSTPKLGAYYYTIKTQDFPVFMRNSQDSSAILDAIVEPPLAVPDPILLRASGAAVPISVLLLHRFWATLVVRFHTVCTKGRIRLLHSGLP